MPIDVARRSDRQHAALVRLQRDRARGAGDRARDTARTVRHGQAARRASTRCCGGRSRSSRSCATRTGGVARPEPAQQARRRRHVRCSTTREPGDRIARASARSAGRSCRSIRRRKPGWSPAASASRRSRRWPKRWPRARTPMTLFYGARIGRGPLLRGLLRARSARALVLTTEDGTRGERGRVTRAARARARRARAPADAVTIYACGPTPMMRAVAATRRRAPDARCSSRSNRSWAAAWAAATAASSRVRQRRRQSFRALVPRRPGVRRARPSSGTQLCSVGH